MSPSPESDLPVETRVESAHLPEPQSYGDARLFALQRERVFARAWHYAGDAQDLLRAGAEARGEGAAALQPLRWMPGALDEELLWIAQGADLALFSNVCTHRGHPLAERACTARALRCPYHGRRFDLRGQFEAAPGFEGARDFPGPHEHLPRVRHARFGPLLFASLSGEPEFEAWLGTLRARFAHLELEAARFDAARSRDFECEAHWALYCDNYLEGLHIPFVHPGLNAALEFESYRTLLEPWGVLQIARARAGEAHFELPAQHPEAGQRIAAWYAWLFPGTMLNVYPWGLSLNVVVPLGPTRTRIHFRSYVLDESLLGQGAGADLAQVELEDEAALEAVQRGVRSRLARPGRYAPRWECGTHHFHALLQAALSRPPQPAHPPR